MEKREIKFRAWDKGNEYMVYAEEHSGLSEYYFDFVKNTFQLLMPVEDDYPYVVDAIIMQYTGMKDKNGKEIWEGDLVKRNGHIRKVVFNEGAFCLWGIKQFEGTLDPMTVMFHGSALYNFLSDIEVIGNVYENTELSVGKI